MGATYLVVAGALPHPSRVPTQSAAPRSQHRVPTTPAGLSPAAATAAAARRRGLRLKYITRIEQPARRTYGWQVRVVARGRVAASGFFADAAHGTVRTGTGRALRAAMAFRDDAEHELGVPVTRRRVHTVARSNTGVLGVYWSELFGVYVAFYPVAPRRYVRELFRPERDTARARKAALAAATAARAAGMRAYQTV